MAKSLAECLELYGDLFTKEEKEALRTKSRGLALKEKIPPRQAITRTVEARRDEARAEYDKIEKVIKKHIKIEKVLPEKIVPEKKIPPVAKVPAEKPKIVPEVKPAIVPKEVKPKEPVVEKPIPKEATIPEFKSTEDALAFGKIATPEQIEALKTKKEESLSKSDVSRAKGDLQGAMDEATRGQFFREAIQSAEKEIVEPEKVEKPIAKIPEVVMSPELKELHEHKARTLGFEKAGGSFVEGYLKRLAKIAEKTDMPAAMAAYDALSEYKKGNINQAALEAEKILGKLHKAEKEAVLREPKKEVAPIDIEGNELVDMDDVPMEINPNGTVTLYHRTTPEKAENLRKTGKFRSLENTNETFFSNKLDGQAVGYGDAVITVKVAPSKTRLDDAFHEGEVTVAVSNKFLSKANIVKVEPWAAKAPPEVPKKVVKPVPEVPEVEKELPSVYRPRGLKDAVDLREETGSLETYDLQSQTEWLGDKRPPKDGKLTLYRATPTGQEIRPGDYVTNDLAYAKLHIKANLGGKGKIAELESTLDDIFPADGPKEFWYAPKSIEKKIEKEPLTETKSRLLENIKSEKGSSELINDLSRIGADAMRRGHATYKAFTAEMKVELSSVWEKIKSLIRKAYFAAKKILKSERGAVEIGKPPKPTPKVERKRPWLTKSQKERRAKKKAIKEKQLKIENAKEAKEQIHGMIRNRRQDLNLAAYETNLFINDIEQQTTKTQREIIPFIIEKTDIPESLNRPDLEKAYEKDKDNLAPIALQVKQHFDAGWLKMKKNIPDMSAEQIENYVTHIWDLDKGQKRIVTNWFITQNRFLKKRYIETLKEGIEELGLTPKMLDISEIIRIHDGVANRAIENVKFVEGLKNLKYEGMPLIARADLAPQSWVYFDHPALRRGLVIPGKLKMGEKVSPELSSLLEEMGVAIGRRISPVAFGKPVGKAGEYISGEPPEIRFQRFMSSRTIAHEIGHHLDEVLGLGYKFLNNYASELYEINRERIEKRKGETGTYGETYARSTEEQIAEFFATLFTDASKAYRIAPNATADALNRLRQDEVLSKLIDFDFEKQAKNLIEEQLNTLVKLPVKVHPDLEKPLKVVFESRIKHPMIQAYEITNGVLKKTNLSLSLFHHGALGETGIAIMGLRKVLNIYFNPVKIYKAMAQGKFDVFEKEPIARRWIGAGLQVGATADVPINMIQSKLNNLARKTKNVPLINKTTEFIRTFNEVWDKALWNYLHDTLKLYACESLGIKIDPTKDMTKQEQEITQFVNDTFGGQNWDTLMISPKSLQIMTWSLLSADWTTSTVRQALSPTGIGRAHKETIGMRRKLGAYFWIKAGLYFGVGINMLNYTFREWDEKENPKYYEGMGKRTILDKTMAGNTMGHKTHLFVGRYEDGTERYIRWGKQFRELPELFFDDTGFNPISATLKKVGGKLAPMVQLTSKIFTGTSPSGFRDDDIYGKKGWDRVYGIGKTLIKSPLPFATRALFQEGKKFHLTDLAMPSSKGMTRWKSINLFKHAIIKRDDQLLKETYQFTLMNNLPAYTLFSTALTILKAESTKEFTEGIKTIEDVKKLLDKVDDPKDLIRLGNKYKRIQKENVDRKIGMDLLDQAIRDIKKYELIESE